MHLKSVGFRALRKLNLNNDLRDDDFNIYKIHQHDVGSINIIVGANGGGKSTMIDVVRAAFDATVLPSIPRENINNSTSSCYVVNFVGGGTISCEFKAVSIEEFHCTITAKAGGYKVGMQGLIKKNCPNEISEDWQELIGLFGGTLEYRDWHDESRVSVEAFIEALNIDAKHLSGLAPYPLDSKQVVYSFDRTRTRNQFELETPIYLIEGGIVSLAFNDDHMQHNHVPISQFPSGWKAYGGLIAWLSTRPDGAVCVIEEPETHIHPNLLRVLIKRISAIAKEKFLQVFITTHSHTLIDIDVWSCDDIKLFEVDGYQVKELTEPAFALAGLGVRPSDVFQSNSIIWVEGASDRIYLLHWLSLWCKEHSKETLIENLDFSFCFYGGAMLSHFSSATSENLIEIFKVNQNSIVIMDRDLDFQVDALDQEDTGAKSRVYRGFANLTDDKRFCWVTQGYTLESYLPARFRDLHFSYEKKRLVKVAAISKVSIAQKFSKQTLEFQKSFDPDSDLAQWIERTYLSIWGWSH